MMSFISLYGVLLAWIPPQVDEDRLVSAVHLIMSGHVGYPFTRAKVCTLDTYTYQNLKTECVLYIHTITIVDPNMSLRLFPSTASPFPLM